MSLSGAGLAHATGNAEKPALPGRTPATFTLEPVPKWVVPLVEDKDAPSEHASMHYRVIDDQTRLDGTGEWNYSHFVRVIDESGGMSKAAQIEVSFDPTYQTLAFHHLDIIRAGKRINKFDRTKVQLLQRETQLEKQMYDGRVTASIIVDDARVGDQIDVAYSVRGANPVFMGKAVGFATLQSFRGPSANSQVRFVYPSNRQITVKTWHADDRIEKKTLGAEEEVVVRKTALPQTQYETNETAFAAMKANLEYSEFETWSDVAAWGTTLFQEPVSASPTVDAKAAEIRGKTADPAERLLLALQFVQTEVRYFGTEFGASSHRPAAPETVITQRFGDCKDKVLLLIALLHRLDIRASPVLVSTDYRTHITDFAPSPLAFNHVIAKVPLNGTTYWLDATRDHQTGSLAERQSVNLGRGLELVAGSTQPVLLPSGSEVLRFTAKDVITVMDFAQEVALESTMTYRGDSAEAMRSALAMKSESEIQAAINTWYVRTYPKIHTVAPMEIVDSASEDKISLIQHFAIPDAIRLNDKKLLMISSLSWAMIDFYRMPNEQTRHFDFGLFPGRVTHDVEIIFPEDLLAKAEPRVTDDSDAVSIFHESITVSPRRLELHDEGQLLSDELPATDWNAHSAFVAKLLPRFGSTTQFASIAPNQQVATQERIKAADADIKSGKLKVGSPRQQGAYGLRIFETAQLTSNRLPAEARSEVLTARGTNNELLGDSLAAKADYDAALKLTPEDPTLLRQAATNAMLLGDNAHAIELAHHALTIKPNDQATLETLARADYMQENYSASIEDLQTLLKNRAAVEHGYALLWLGFATKRAGGDTNVALAPYVETGLPSTWPRPLIDWQLGKLSLEDARRAAAASDATRDKSQHLEANFFIGEQALIDGNRAAAISAYQNTVDLGLTEQPEDGLARLRLAQLKQ